MSEEAKHTPGKWTCRAPDGETCADTLDRFGDWSVSLDDDDDRDDDVTGYTYLPVRTRDTVVALVVGATTLEGDDEDVRATTAANAILIAAAPDLLAVCLAYRDARETDDFDTTADRREALLAAIAKATGSPP